MAISAPEQSITRFSELQALGVEIHEVPEAAAIDYDRTVGDPLAALERLYNVARIHGIDPEDLQKEASRVEQDGGTYEPLTSIQSQLLKRGSTVNLQKLAEDYAAHPNPTLVYPDAPDFVRRLDCTPENQPYPHAIATTGPSQIWQKSFKLAAAGCGLHVDFLTTDRKAEYHKGLRSPDGTYDYAIYDKNGVLTGIARAERLIAVDDKPRCLVGGEGYLVRRAEPLPSQAGDWSNDLTVCGLSELTIQDGRMVRQPPSDVALEGLVALPQPQRVYRPIRYKRRD